MKRISLFLMLFGLVLFAHAQPMVSDSIETRQEQPVQRKWNKARITSVILTVLSGPVAGQRIYLGTHPRVPFIYAITLGGGLGVLPLIDLGFILFSKDQERLKDNPNVFIWSRKAQTR